MKWVLAILLGLSFHAAVAAERHLILAVGAPGDETFAAEFEEAAAKWEVAARRGEVRTQRALNRHELQAAIDSSIQSEPSELWIVLIGHGTFDGRVAKFNLEGADVSATELAGWLEPWKDSLVFVNAASASAPFLPALAGEDRVLISATKSGHEVNYSRFGSFLAGALEDDTADLNKDEQISILEAFLLASQRTAEFFDKEGRLATEHALIDDNGDGKGTRGDWYEGLRLVKKPDGDSEPDGLRARNLHLVPNELNRSLSSEARKRRNELEREAEKLREKRQELGDGEYYRRLEEIFLEIARIYAKSADS